MPHSIKSSFEINEIVVQVSLMEIIFCKYQIALLLYSMPYRKSRKPRIMSDWLAYVCMSVCPIVYPGDETHAFETCWVDAT